MDLVSTLASALNVEPRAAEAVAGAVLGTVKGQAADSDASEGAEDALESAVPELSGWMDTAKEVAAENDDSADLGGLGGLLGAMGSGAGNQLLGAVAGKSAQNAALLGSVLGSLGLNASMAQVAAPIVLQFLESRMDAGTLQTLLSVAPMLTGKTEGGSAGGMMGALGSFLK
jgi:hypothetical protein